MKTRLVPFLASLALLPLLPGCGTNLDFWDVREFDVDIPASAAPFLDGKEKSELVDLTDVAQHADIVQQLGKIDNVVVPEIWLEVSNVDASNQTTLASGKFEASEDTADATRILVAEYKDLPVANGGKLQLQLATEPQVQVEKLALEKKKFRIYYSASMDKLPAKFHVKARVHVQATLKL